MLGSSPAHSFDVYDWTLLTDAVSLVCGEADGVSECGSRELYFYDLLKNQEHSLDGSSLLSLSGQTLTVQNTGAFSGYNRLESRVRLTDYTSLG